MTELPGLVDEGDLKLLGNYINVSEKELPLIYGWIFCALAGVKPYPILILQGEQGTGKSTTCKIIRALIDPSSVPLRSPPRETRDLLVSAANNHIVVLDNLSGIKPEISDCLCRLSTGGGIDVRALYTDNEQNLIDIQKPVMVNGIDDIATRPDLAERSIIINLPVIDSDKRRGESEFWKEFEQDKPKIFAGLLNCLSQGLINIDDIVLRDAPRMADAARWVTACEHGLGQPGEFVKAHLFNQLHAIEAGIEASPIGSAVMMFMADREEWKGRPSDLFKILEDIAGERQTKSRAWPQSLKGLNNIIKRLMPSFRKLGINIEKETTHDREYVFQKVQIYPPQAPHLPQAKPDKASSVGGYKTYPPHGAVKRTSGADSNSNRPSINPYKSMSGALGADRAVRNQHFQNDDVEIF